MTSHFFQSLHGRLLIVLLGLAALPALLIGGLAYRNARQTVEARVIAQLTSIADLKKEQIVTWLNDRAADARLIADNFLNEETSPKSSIPTQTRSAGRPSPTSSLTICWASSRRARVTPKSFLWALPAG